MISVFSRKQHLLTMIAAGLLASCSPAHRVGTTTVDTQQGTPYTNPVMWADLPDMSITRSGSDFYLISTTMHLMPGAPVMHSRDLVHWQTASYVFDSLTDNSKYYLQNGTVYGRGQWASSIRYYKGKYYVLFSPNDQPYRSYFYQADNPAGKWTLVSRLQHFHDASLFFDDDGKAYVFSGTGSLRELEPDLSAVKAGGVDMKIFERDADETGLLEGSQVIKRNGRYYLLMISWPRGKPRRQVCFRADKITGPYEKKVILQDNFAGFPYVGQGAVINDENDNWYALIFQDRGAVGRVPLLMPCRWENGWPMLGNIAGKVPLHDTIPLQPHDFGRHLVESDDFSGKTLKLNWQWNHNPVNDAWSLTERPGFLRLKTSRIVNNLYAAPNSITQRMEGPICSGIVSLDLSHMNDGDVAGFAAFNGNSGLLEITAEGNKKILRMATNVVELDDNTKAILTVAREDKATVNLSQNQVYLKIDGNFNLGKDTATFSYSTDNQHWITIGTPFKMVFDYRKLFMGTRFAIFNYTTKTTGGYVDVDRFEFRKKSN